MHRYRLLLLTIVIPVVGSLQLLAFTPVGWWWVAPLSLAVLFWGINQVAHIWQAFFLGLAFGVAFFTAGVLWIYDAFVGYIGLPVYAGVPLAGLLYVALALFPAVGCAVGWWVSSAGFGRVVALVACWTLSEWLRGWLILGGFPWLSLGYTQVPDGWLAGWIPLLGVYGTTAMLAITAACLLSPWLVRKHKKRLLFVPVVLAVVLGAPHVLNNVWTWTTQSGALSVSVLQGNVPQSLKWQEGQVEQVLSDYLEMADASTGRVIVFPETAIPMRMSDLPADYQTQLRAIAEKRHGVMAAGLFLEDASGEQLYNGVQVFAENEVDSYRKQHLTPYGEYIPLASLLVPLLKRMHIPYHNLQAGKRNVPVTLVDGIRAGISICYEDAFGDEWRGQYADSHFLINVTNDAWFDGSAMPMQHLQIAQARALESGRWLVRASNTGESAMINHNGQIVQQLDKDVQGVLTYNIPLTRGKTLYTVVGDWPIIILMSIVLAIISLYQLRRHYRRYRHTHRPRS